MEVNLTLTDRYEPLEGGCSGCGDTRNFFVYTNEDKSKFKAGCCLCNTYGDIKSTPLEAVLSWSGKFLFAEPRF